MLTLCDSAPGTFLSIALDVLSVVLIHGHMITLNITSNSHEYKYTFKIYSEMELWIDTSSITYIYIFWLGFHQKKCSYYS